MQCPSILQFSFQLTTARPPQDPVPSSTCLTPATPSDSGTAISTFLSQRLGSVVFLSYNLPDSNEDYQMFVQRQLVVHLMRLGMLPDKTGQGSVNVKEAPPVF